MDGYIKIQIGDQSIGLKFAYPAIKWFTEACVQDKVNGNDVYYIESKSEKGEDESTLTDYGFAKLVQCAYRNNCLLKEEQPVLKFEDFTNWVDENNTEEGKENLAAVMTCYAESTFSKKIVENAEKKRQEAEVKLV